MATLASSYSVPLVPLSSRIASALHNSAAVEDRRHFLMLCDQSYDFRIYVEGFLK
jgi:ferritin-like protein